MKIAQYVCCPGKRKSVSLGHFLIIAQYVLYPREKERVSLAGPVCVTELGETGQKAGTESHTERREEARVVQDWACCCPGWTTTGCL